MEDTTAMTGQSGLERRIAALETEIGRLGAIEACERLMNIYGYMLDKCYYEDIPGLFVPEGIARPEIYHDGVCYLGGDGVRRFYDFFKQRHAEGGNGPVEGEFVDHPMMQHVITVLPGNERAYGRSRTLVQMARHKDKAGGPLQLWGAGIYENEYRCVDGRWLFARINMTIYWATHFDEGWAHVVGQPVPPPERLFPDDPFGPDRFVDHGASIWPLSTAAFPFHFAHPATGAAITGRLPVGQESLPDSE